MHFSMLIIEGDALRIAVAQNATYSANLRFEIPQDIPNTAWLPIIEQPLQIRDFPWERHNVICRTLSDWQPAFGPHSDVDGDANQQQDINGNNVDPVNGQTNHGGGGNRGAANRLELNAKASC